MNYNKQASDLVAGNNNTPLSRLPSLAHALHGALFGASTNPAATSAAAPPPALVLWALSLVQSRATSGPGGCSGSAGRGGGGSTGGMPFSMVRAPFYLHVCVHGMRVYCIHACVHACVLEKRNKSM